MKRRGVAFCENVVEETSSFQSGVDAMEFPILQFFAHLTEKANGG
jgi:hypothetical protein